MFHGFTFETKNQYTNFQSLRTTYGPSARLSFRIAIREFFVQMIHTHLKPPLPKICSQMCIQDNLGDLYDNLDDLMLWLVHTQGKNFD